MRHHAFCAMLVVAGLASLSPTQNATAQAPPPEIRGKVVSIAGDTLAVESQGRTVELDLAPDTFIGIVASAKLDEIKPGSFVGTTNTDTDAPNGGLASEVHIFPPGVKLGEGQRVMGPPGGTTRMTNATVTAKQDTEHAAAAKPTTRMTNAGVSSVQAEKTGETVLELTFPGGTRRVRVPANALISSVTPADRGLLKPGILVSVRAQPAANGHLTARAVTTGPNGTAPVR